MSEIEESKRTSSKVNKLRILTNSASFALFLSLVLFLYQEISTKSDFMEVVDNLSEIENSLSTRYLGIFPEYISDIDLLMEEVIQDQNNYGLKDSVIIFQDVLYYGMRSDANGFRDLMRDLLTISDNGSHITVAFYDPNSIMFERLIRDELISFQFQEHYRKERETYHEILKECRMRGDIIRTTYSDAEIPRKMQELVSQLFIPYYSKYTTDEYEQRKLLKEFGRFANVKTYILQSCFDSTKKVNRVGIEELLRKTNIALPLAEEDNKVDTRINLLFNEIESIKSKYLKKPIDEIKYLDYETAHREISAAIVTMLLESKNIELLPLREDLMMCCWMRTYKGKGRAIFAFPSKYSTEEIGFISQDKAFVRYINTMLKGVKGSINIE
jgi:hypothetical protein